MAILTRLPPYPRPILLYTYTCITHRDRACMLTSSMYRLYGFATCEHQVPIAVRSRERFMTRRKAAMPLETR